MYGGDNQLIMTAENWLLVYVIGGVTMKVCQHERWAYISRNKSTNDGGGVYNGRWHI